MIAAYRGTSLISKLIKIRTWGEYSHVSWLFDDATEIEAWQGKGVTHTQYLGQNHTEGTQIDLYDFVKPITSAQSCAIRNFLKAQVGKGYDYSGVFGFLWVGRILGLHHKRNKWFCSELVSQACQEAGLKLLNKPSWMIDPSSLVQSPLLHKVGGIVVRHTA